MEGLTQGLFVAGTFTLVIAFAANVGHAALDDGRTRGDIGPGPHRVPAVRIGKDHRKPRRLTGGQRCR